MNALGLVARIVLAIALFIALVMSFVSSFIVLSIDLEGGGVSTGVSAWHRLGVLGGLVVVGALLLAVVSSALPIRVAAARRVLAGMAGAACLVAGFVFVLYLVIETNDLPAEGLDVQMTFGWSGYATLAALAVGAVAGVAASVIADPMPRSHVPPPPNWA
jgi:hypothetical protein